MGGKGGGGSWGKKGGGREGEECIGAVGRGGAGVRNSISDDINQMLLGELTPLAVTVLSSSGSCAVGLYLINFVSRTMPRVPKYSPVPKGGQGHRMLGRRHQETSEIRLKACYLHGLTFPLTFLSGRNPVWNHSNVAQTVDLPCCCCWSGGGGV